jgi:hypothetical protein
MIPYSLASSGCHEVVALHVLRDSFGRLAGVLGDDLL